MRLMESNGNTSTEEPSNEGLNSKAFQLEREQLPPPKNADLLNQSHSENNASTSFPAKEQKKLLRLIDSHYGPPFFLIKKKESSRDSTLGAFH